MKYQIRDGSVTLGGETVLSHIDFEIQGSERIAIVGRNGAGKTTLLRLIAGRLELDRDDRRQGPGVYASRSLTVGMLEQNPSFEGFQTAEEWLADKGLEGEKMFTRLGFSRDERHKKLSEFSGGERTRIALIGLLLERPELLLLDEPTNHLDLDACRWLEQYLNQWRGAVVMVSHDRFFLDRTAQIIYELEGGKLTRYSGNYTEYRSEKRKRYNSRMKAYLRQQDEIARQEELIRRFKNKPAKASFARSRKKILERMERIPKPAQDMAHIFTGDITPLIHGSKWVLEAEHLMIGYDRPLLELSLRIRRGQKIGLIGENGAGKTAFLKTAAGLLQPVKGQCALGNQITIGYFDQLSAQIQSEKTVLEHFKECFPALTDQAARKLLGAWLFPGKEAGRSINSLSGGERARLVLAELLESRPNFLILDEPTNHMDIQAKETLESAFQAYQGTILFVSHDRYFLRQVAQSILIFEEGRAMYYPFGYEHYLERKEREEAEGGLAARIQAEEQALIEGLKAVPKAERHRLKEIPQEEAYSQWQERLIMERTDEIITMIEELEESIRETQEEQLRVFADPEELYDPETWEKRLNELGERLSEAQEQWLEQCLLWYEERMPEDMYWESDG